MTAFDFDAAARWAARLRASGSLARRSADALPFADERKFGGQGILLDTCVYLDQLQGRAPVVVERVIENRQISHSKTAIAEMPHAVGASTHVIRARRAPSLPSAPSSRRCQGIASSLPTPT